MPTGKLALFGLASVSVMLPLSRNLWGGAVLTVIVSALIGMLFGGVAVMLAHLAVFGAHPILIAVLNKYLPRKNIFGGITDKKCEVFWYIIRLLIKLVYFNIAIFLLYNIAVLVFFPTLSAQYWLVALIVSLAFILYDFVLQQLFLQIKQWVNNIVK